MPSCAQGICMPCGCIAAMAHGKALPCKACYVYHMPCAPGTGAMIARMAIRCHACHHVPIAHGKALPCKACTRHAVYATCHACYACSKALPCKACRQPLLRKARHSQKLWNSLHMRSMCGCLSTLITATRHGCLARLTALACYACLAAQQLQ